MELHQLHPKLVEKLKKQGLISDQGKFILPSLKQWEDWLLWQNQNYHQASGEFKEVKQSFIFHTIIEASKIRESLDAGTAEKDYLIKFGQELFQSPKSTLSREVQIGAGELIRHEWLVGTKFDQNKKALIIGLDVTTHKWAQLRLEEQEQLIERDDLTGLYNMRTMFKRIEHELERGKRSGKSTGVVMMDLDHFKNVNDSTDHLFGSFVLKEIGNLIQGLIRKTDLAARYGGDEFLLVLAEVDEAGLASFSERLRQVIGAYEFREGHHVVHLTTSIGYALANPENYKQTPQISARELVRLADQALWEAKAQGRNCVRGKHWLGDREYTSTLGL